MSDAPKPDAPDADVPKPEATEPDAANPRAKLYGRLVIVGFALLLLAYVIPTFLNRAG